MPSRVDPRDVQGPRREFGSSLRLGIRQKRWERLAELCHRDRPEWRAYDEAIGGLRVRSHCQLWVPSNFNSITRPRSSILARRIAPQDAVYPNDPYPTDCDSLAFGIRPLYREYSVGPRMTLV